MKTLSLRGLRTASIALPLIALSSLMACSSDGSAGPGGGSAASQILLAPGATAVGIGKTLRLEASALDATGAAVNAGISWSSENTSIATVSGGVVTGRAAGTVLIRAVSGRAETSVTVTVGQPVASIVVADPAPVGLPVGGRLTLQATVRDGGGGTLVNRQVEWTSSAPSVARVEGNALIGVSSGTASIIGTSEGRADTASVTVGAPPTVTRRIAIADEFFCGLTNVGAAWCWGRWLGDQAQGFVAEGYWPREIGGGAFFTTISVSTNHACALTAEGQAWCWGENEFGELGNGTIGAPFAYSTVASPVQTTVRFTSIHAGQGYTLALATDGRAWAWGRGGALGDGTTVTRTTPVRVAGNLTFRLIATNLGRWGGLGITTDNVMYEWSSSTSTAPVAIPQQSSSFVSRLTTLEAASGLVAGLSAGGELWAWTWESTGNGIGATFTPARLQPSLTFRKFETDGLSALAITTTGTMVGWGYRELGILGNGSSGSTIQTTPVQPSGGRTYVDFAMGGRRAYAIDANGGTYAWGGSNFSNVMALGSAGEIYTTPQPPVTAALLPESAPRTLTLEPGKNDSIGVFFVPRGGSFRADGNGMAVPRGTQSLAITGLPSGVSAKTRRIAIDYGVYQAPGFMVTFTASSSAPSGDAIIGIRGSAAGAEPATLAAGIQVTGGSGATLNLVCTSSSTPATFPAGYHCMTNSAGASVPGKYAIADLIGAWYDSSVGVCVNYGSNGTATTRFKPAGSGSAATASGKWGAVSKKDGSLEQAPGNGWYIFTAAHDAQMQALVFFPSVGAFNGYNFQRGNCPW